MEADRDSRPLALEETKPEPDADGLVVDHRSCAPFDDVNIVEVCIPASSRFVSIARQTVDAVSAETQMPSSDRAAVRLAVGEACNNAVLHAHPGLIGHEHSMVTVSCRIEPDALQIEVTNEGTARLPVIGAKMPDPLSEHGRGIVLIEAMMDSVEYVSRNGCTTIRMRKQFTPETCANV